MQRRNSQSLTVLESFNCANFPHRGEIAGLGIPLALQGAQKGKLRES
jgi:hypothetical protein